MDIQLVALVCSQDERTIKVLQVLLADMSIEMELSASRDEAGRHLIKRHFDGVFVDAGLESSAELLRDVKAAPGGRRAVSFAILEGMTSVKEAFSFGASFILYKPLSIERTKTSLRAAHGLMMRERRRHFRHSLEGVTAALLAPGLPDVQCEVLDLSHGGMSLKLAEYIERRGEVRARFTLPGATEQIQVEGEVTWADNFGRIGVRFAVVPPASRAVLDEWLTERSRTMSDGSRAAKPARKSHPAAAEADVPAAPKPEPAPPVPADAEETAVDLGPRVRQSLRAGLDVGLSVVTLRSGVPYLLQAVCDDLTPEGVGAKVNGELCPGEPVLLHLSLPSLEAMKLHADVRHRHGNRIGFEFVGLSEDQRDELADICELLPVAE